MRTQADLPEDFARYSDESALRCSPSEDRTRQEFKEECDVNVILRRVGAGGFEPRPVSYGLQNTDDELQGVFAAAVAARDAWLRLPASLRRRYPGWDELLSAVERGEAVLVDSDGVEAKPPAVPAAVPPVVSPVS